MLKVEDITASTPEFYQITNSTGLILNGVFAASDSGSFILLPGPTATKFAKAPINFGPFIDIYDPATSVQGLAHGGQKIFYIDGVKNLYYFDLSNANQKVFVDNNNNEELHITNEYIYAARNSGLDITRYPLNNPTTAAAKNSTGILSSSVVAAFEDHIFIGAKTSFTLSYLRNNSFDLPPSQIILNGGTIANVSSMSVFVNDDYIYVLGTHFPSYGTYAVFRIILDLNYAVVELQPQWLTFGRQLGSISIVYDRSGLGPSTNACDDAIDNDEDGLTDYPSDPGCSSFQDNDEYNQSSDDDCPLDPLKTSPGICGCGVPDTNGQFDTDSDGFVDCIDECPNDPEKHIEGVCGCGKPDRDRDEDSIPDCNDGCPLDSRFSKSYEQCCGDDLSDLDGDGVADCACQQSYDPLSNSCSDVTCGASTFATIMSCESSDSDGDGVQDDSDTCPNDGFKKSAEDIKDCGCGSYLGLISKICEQYKEFEPGMDLPKPITSSTVDENNILETLVKIEPLVEPGSKYEFSSLLAAKRKSKNKIIKKYKVYSKITHEVLELSGGQVKVVGKVVRRLQSKKTEVTIRRKISNPGSILVRVTDQRFMTTTTRKKSRTGTTSKVTTQKTQASLPDISRPISIVSR